MVAQKVVFRNDKFQVESDALTRDCGSLYAMGGMRSAESTEKNTDGATVERSLKHVHTSRREENKYANVQVDLQQVELEVSRVLKKNLLKRDYQHLKPKLSTLDFQEKTTSRSRLGG